MSFLALEFINSSVSQEFNNSIVPNVQVFGCLEKLPEQNSVNCCRTQDLLHFCYRSNKLRRRSCYQVIWSDQHTAPHWNTFVPNVPIITYVLIIPFVPNITIIPIITNIPLRLDLVIQYIKTCISLSCTLVLNSSLLVLRSYRYY